MHLDARPPKGNRGIHLRKLRVRGVGAAPVLSIVRFLGRVAPKLPVLKLHNKDFTRDTQALAKLDADPLTRGEVQPAGTVAALLKATDRMRAEFSTITIPLLIMHGTKDKATVPAGSQLFYDRAGSNDKTLKLYEGHFHDLLNDIGKEGVMADVASWINARVARTPDILLSASQED